ncbi:MAG: DUF2459 domain-containing protein [Pirellulaceae bacterium]
MTAIAVLSCAVFAGCATTPGNLNTGGLFRGHTAGKLFRGQSLDVVDVVDGDQAVEAAVAAPSKSIHVVSHGWHTGLVLRTDDIPDDAWPDKQFFADRRYVEVGWGDEGFYRAERITPGLVAQAGFWPTPSVLHVVGFDQPVEQYFPISEVVEIEVSDEGFARLCRHIGDTYALDERGEVQPLGPGIYGASEFYRARGSYYFPKTCNVWTARGLQAAGVPMLPEAAVGARSVIAQARRQGRTLR